jgi:2-haloacid dehalogenase
VAKPDPEIYEALEEASGLRGPALFFTDDRPENIAAAAARGWHTHLFHTPQGLADALHGLGLCVQG